MAEGQFVQRGANFDFCVKNISKLVNYWTPRIMIQDIPWNFQIAKKVSNNEDWLGVYLHCTKDDKSRDWGIAAASSIQLISTFGERTIGKNFEPFFFDYTGKGFGFSKFIKWKDLFDIENGFVKNGKINFNIKVEVARPNDEDASKLKVDFNKNDEDVSKVIMQLTINNIHNLMAVRTLQFLLQNLRWDLTVFKDPKTGLGLRLDCKEDHSEYITFKAIVDFKMKSSIAGVQDIEKTQNWPLKMANVHKIFSIISWNELIKPNNGYVVNNSISFEIKIQVDAVQPAAPKAKKRRASNTPEAESSALECAICLEKIKNQEVSSTVCGHLFCSECIEKVVQARKPCQSCNTEITINNLRRVYLPL